MARVEGFEPNHSGQQPTDDGNPASVGVWGDSDTGVGVFGSSGTIPATSTDIPVSIAGVEGHGFGVPGVFGESDQTVGIIGRSTTGGGVLGVTFTQDADGPSAVFGASVTNGRGVTGFVGSQTAVVGSSVRGTGVHGHGQGVGVFGENLPGRTGGAAGVYGVSSDGRGVRGHSDRSDGMAGVTFGLGAGSQGLHFSVEPGSGVSGTSVLGSGVDGFSFTGPGVRGSSVHDLAGDFNGDVRVLGTLFKSAGGFRIDHPLDPENRDLSHSFVESPEMLNVYGGTVTTDESGDAEVQLPDYFEALNGDPRYQLTVIGEFAQAIVAREVQDNRFAIRTDRPQVKVCWQVTGVRRDPWAEAHPIAVESQKDDRDRERQLRSQARAEEARRRVVELLPEPLREQAGELATADRIDPDRLRGLVEEARSLPTEVERTDPARVEEQWSALQRLVQGTSRGGGQAESRNGL